MKNFFFFSHTNLTGTISVTYATVTGLLSVSNQTEPTLAEPGDDYIPASGTLILEEGETSAAINITILEVSFFIIYFNRGIVWKLKLEAYILLEAM